jgi:hypothetical protein
VVTRLDAYRMAARMAISGDVGSARALVACAPRGVVVIEVNQTTPAPAPVRRARPAIVIRPTAPVEPRAITPRIDFDADEAATAWIAEMRGGRL